jgi:hypothetical protein
VYRWALKTEFWTAGTNKGCPGSYEWCSKNAKLSNKEARWKSGFPAAGENCVHATFYDRDSGENSSIATADCTEVKRFVCEVK